MDDLEFVSVVSFGNGPIRSPKYGVIQFNRDPLFWKRKELEDLVNRDRSGNFTAFSIENYVDRGHALIFRFDEADFKFAIPYLRSGSADQPGVTTRRSSISSPSVIARTSSAARPDWKWGSWR